MSELQDMLRVQARLHRKQGANALGQLFESAIEEIQLLKKTYNQLFDAFQNCHDELVDANERVRDLEKDLTVSNGFIAKKMPIVFAISGKNKGAKLVYEEAVKVLNKFAIEKKQEAILTIKDKWIKKASEMPPQLECRSKGYSCYNWAMFYARELTDEAEQLRKEQE